MPVVSYDLDKKVFQHLKPGINQLKDWKGKASGIANYVSGWGIERFWALSRSPILRGGGIPDIGGSNSEQRNYFAWAVARVVLCEIVGDNLQINANMDTEQFQNRFRDLSFQQQALITEVLIEISATIQFWTMRIDDSQKANTTV